MQSTGVWSLNHDITTSFGLDHNPNFSKLVSTPRRYLQYKGAPICCKHASISIETHETLFVIGFHLTGGLLV